MEQEEDWGWLLDDVYSMRSPLYEPQWMEPPDPDPVPNATVPEDATVPADATVPVEMPRCGNTAAPQHHYFTLDQFFRLFGPDIAMLNKTQNLRHDQVHALAQQTPMVPLVACMLFLFVAVEDFYWAVHLLASVPTWGRPSVVKTSKPRKVERRKFNINVMGGSPLKDEVVGVLTSLGCDPALLLDSYSRVVVDPTTRYAAYYWLLVLLKAYVDTYQPGPQPPTELAWQQLHSTIELAIR